MKEPQTCKSVTLPRRAEHLSLHTSLSFSLQEADINFNHAGSVLSVIRLGVADTFGRVGGFVQLLSRFPIQSPLQFRQSHCK